MRQGWKLFLSAGAMVLLVAGPTVRPAFAVRGARGGGAVRGPRGGGAAVGPRGGTAVRGPSGGGAAVGPYGGAAVRGPSGAGAAVGRGGAAVRGPNGGAAAVGRYGGAAVRGPGGTYAAGRSYGGRYYGGRYYRRPVWGAATVGAFARPYAAYPGWRYYGTVGLATGIAAVSSLAFLSDGILVGTYPEAATTVYVYVVDEDGVQVEYRVDEQGNVLSRREVSTPEE